MVHSASGEDEKLMTQEEFDTEFELRTKGQSSEEDLKKSFKEYELWMKKRPHVVILCIWGQTPLQKMYYSGQTPLRKM